VPTLVNQWSEETYRATTIGGALIVDVLEQPSEPFVHLSAGVERLQLRLSEAQRIPIPINKLSLPLKVGHATEIRFAEVVILPPRRCRRQLFHSRTPGPPPFSAMNSTPAGSGLSCRTFGRALRLRRHRGSNRRKLALRSRPLMSILHPLDQVAKPVV
jgi:hypothetical protein